MVVRSKAEPESHKVVLTVLSNQLAIAHPHVSKRLNVERRKLVPIEKARALGHISTPRIGDRIHELGGVKVLVDQKHLALKKQRPQAGRSITPRKPNRVGFGFRCAFRCARFPVLTPLA